MKNTVLITGGNSGIGLALAIRYLKDGNNVIICGRNEEKLKKTANEIPGLKTILADVSLEEDRNHLFETVKTACPDTNILINNAGIQQKIDVTAMDWQLWKNELNTNLEGPMHLCGLFAPFLAGKENAQIINVSSGLAFRPPVWAPVYGATKAGMHSFTFVLREQLREKGVAVKEIIPPAVGTNLGGGVSQGYGADLDEFADSVYKDLLSDKEEVGFGYTNSIADMTRRTLEQDALEVSKRFLNNWKENGIVLLYGAWNKDGVPIEMPDGYSPEIFRNFEEYDYYIEHYDECFTGKWMMHLFNRHSKEEAARF